MAEHPHAQKGQMDLTINVGSFDDMAWKNAQNTGAVTFMKYKDAQSFSDIYTYQEVYFKTVLDTYNDFGNALSLFTLHPDDWVPSPAQFTTWRPIASASSSLTSWMLDRLADEIWERDLPEIRGQAQEFEFLPVVHQKEWGDSALDLESWETHEAR